jgi:hypothetical protein
MGVHEETGMGHDWQHYMQGDYLLVLNLKDGGRLESLGLEFDGGVLTGVQRWFSEVKEGQRRFALCRFGEDGLCNKAFHKA